MPNLPPPHAPWTVLDRREVVDARPRLTVWSESVSLPDGRVVQDYWRISLPDFVVVVAVTEGDEAILLRQYKHGAGRICTTFPGGLLEPGEDAETAAARELLEETGFACRELVPLGSFVVNGNQRINVAHYFYGVDARRVTLPASGDLEAIEVLRRPFEELPACVGFEGYDLLPHATAIGLAYMHRDRSRRPPSMADDIRIG